MWQRWKGCGVHGSLGGRGDRGPLRPMNQIKRKKWYTTETGGKPSAQSFLHVHGNAMQHRGWLTSLHRGGGGSNCLVLNLATWMKGVFFSFSREKSQQESGHGEERKFHESSTKRSDGKKRQPGTFSELPVYKTKTSFSHRSKINTSLTSVVNSNSYR